MLKVPTQSEDKHVLVNENDFTTKGMLKTPAFYLLWIMYFAGSLSGLLVIGLSQDIARDLGGLSPKTAGYAVAVAAVFNALGRLGWGALSDLIGRLRVFTLLFGLTALSMAALSLFQLNAFTYFAILGIIVSCFGGFLATFPAVCSDYFGTYYFGSNYGLLYQAYGISALIGPLLLSAVSQETHAFLWASVFALLGLVLTFFVRTPGNFSTAGNQRSDK